MQPVGPLGLFDHSIMAAVLQQQYMLAQQRAAHTLQANKPPSSQRPDRNPVIPSSSHRHQQQQQHASGPLPSPLALEDRIAVLQFQLQPSASSPQLHKHTDQLFADTSHTDLADTCDRNIAHAEESKHRVCYDESVLDHSEVSLDCHSDLDTSVCSTNTHVHHTTNKTLQLQKHSGKVSLAVENPFLRRQRALRKTVSFPIYFTDEEE